MSGYIVKILSCVHSGCIFLMAPVYLISDISPLLPMFQLGMPLGELDFDTLKRWHNRPLNKYVSIHFVLGTVTKRMAIALKKK